MSYPSLSKRLIALHFLSPFFQTHWPLFVISGNNHSSSSAATWSCLFFSLFFFFLCHRLHIIPPPNLVRNRRRPPFFIFDIRWLLVLFSWKPMLLPSQIGAGGKGRWRERETKEESTFFPHVSFILRQYGSTIRSKLLARKRSRNVTDLTSR